MFSSGLNIGAFKEATEHFLSAIDLQSSANSQLWSTLRRALQSMVLFVSLAFPLTLFDVQFQERPDLADQAQPGRIADLDIFRKEGFDF